MSAPLFSTSLAAKFLASAAQGQERFVETSGYHKLMVNVISVILKALAGQLHKLLLV